jgi:hypothetical protein
MSVKPFCIFFIESLLREKKRFENFLRMAPKDASWA